jgi:cytochrome P450
MAVTITRKMGDGAGRTARGWLRSPRRPSHGAQATEFDPLDAQVLADPYPSYAELLATGPLHYSAKRRVWIISRHEHVHAAARAHDALSSAESITPARSTLPMLIALDRPAHTRLRKVVAPYFTHDALGRSVPMIEQIARRAVDELLAAEAPDAVAHLAAPVPVDVIAHLLGVPLADRTRFRTWSDRVIEGFGATSPRAAATVFGATMRLHAYFRDAFAERRSTPRDDLLGHLTAAALSDEERFWFALLLLVAGNETTTSLLGGMVLAFAENPGEYARVRGDPELIPSTVEETLRHVSPIQGFYRTALRDYDVGGATIPAGGRVLLLFGAANRDPRRYADPDRFDVARNPSDHLAFGMGIHFCLGVHLARLEAAIVLRALTERVERLELRGGPVWNGNPSLRGLAHLPVRC